CCVCLIFFFSSRRRHTRCYRDWSSDVCSSDLKVEGFLLRSTLRAVVAQRLVRVLCDRCKAPRTLTSADLAADPRYALLGLGAGEIGRASCRGRVGGWRRGGRGQMRERWSERVR